VLAEQQFADFGEQGGHGNFIGRDIGSGRSPAQGKPAGQMGSRFAFDQARVAFIGFRAFEQQLVESIRAKLHDGAERCGCFMA
jgi:hypothetical protein